MCIHNRNNEEDERINDLLCNKILSPDDSTYEVLRSLFKQELSRSNSMHGIDNKNHVEDENDATAFLNDWYSHVLNNQRVQNNITRIINKDPNGITAYIRIIIRNYIRTKYKKINAVDYAVEEFIDSEYRSKYDRNLKVEDKITDEQDSHLILRNKVSAIKNIVLNLSEIYQRAFLNYSLSDSYGMVDMFLENVSENNRYKRISRMKQTLRSEFKKHQIYPDDFAGVEYPGIVSEVCGVLLEHLGIDLNEYLQLRGAQQTL